MPSRFADDEAANPELPENQEPEARAEEVTEVQAPEVNEAELWAEPAVAAQRILTEIFRSGGKTAPELEDLLNRQSVDPQGFIDYWCRESFLKEVVSGREKRFELSKRGVLELELDVA